MGRRLMMLLGAALLLATMGGFPRSAAGDVLAQSGGDYDVAWSVMGSAGEQFVSGGDYQMGFTLAQDTPAMISSGGGYQVVQGTWALTGFCFWMDVNCDCSVTVEDLQAVADTWRCGIGDGCYDDRHDVDADGVITVIDVMQIAAEWGWTCP
jgi:hypothetical protein